MKITYDEYSYILSYQQKHTLQKLCCTFQVTETNNEDHFKSYIVESNIKWIIYIIIFIPAIIVEIFYSMWAYGLKDLSILQRNIHVYTFNKYDAAFERVEEVLDGS